MTQINTDNKKDDVVKISSVSEYLEAIRASQEEYKESFFLYRGESSDYGNTAFLPSVFRTSNWEKNEIKMYRDVLFENPFSFKEDTSSIEKLVRMQHNGLPTRLLDLTSNKLVALYNACKKDDKAEKDKQEEDGYVYLVKNNKDHIATYNDERIIFLLRKIGMENGYTYPPHLLRDFVQFDILQCAIAVNVFLQIKENSVDKNSDLYNSLKEGTSPVHYSGIWQTAVSKLNSDAKGRCLFGLTPIQLEVILNEYEKQLLEDNVFDFYYKDLQDINIIPSIITSVMGLAFAAPKNDKRAIAQSSYFYLYPEKDFIGYLKNLTIFYNKIVVDASKKGKILKELDELNINQRTLFPDLPNSCEYFKNKYTND